MIGRFGLLRIGRVLKVKPFFYFDRRFICVLGEAISVSTLSIGVAHEDKLAHAVL